MLLGCSEGAALVRQTIEGRRARSLANRHAADENTSPPKFDDPYEERKYLKHRLAIAFRIFAQYGFAENIAGHITVRDPVDPSSFWVNPFGLCSQAT